MTTDKKESLPIKGRGGKRPGAGRPLGSPNKLTRPLKEAAALEGEACLNALVRLRDHAESEQVQLAAATAILDRGFGRPRQDVSVSEEERVTIIVNRHLDDIPPQVVSAPLAIPTGDVMQVDEERKLPDRAPEELRYQS
ncbi:MAG: hypothetical protein U0223_07475 [Nitrospira sp.]|nr:hypothetical protein [Nitrospira sp.]